MAEHKDHYSHYCNHECEYFPCHKVPEGFDFNCLFCYCPLYALGDKCGGNSADRHDQKAGRLRIKIGAAIKPRRFFVCF